MSLAIPRLRVWPEAPWGKSAAWQQIPSYKSGAPVLATVRCANGHWSSIGIAKHKIVARNLASGATIGAVTPSVVCPAAGCDWHEWIDLEDWTEGRPEALDHEKVVLIAVHHSKGPGMQPVGDIEDYHRRPKVRVRPAQDPPGHGWVGIGYHFLIDQAGNLHDGMPEGFQGNHAPKWNYRSVAVCLLGNFDVESPTAPQLDQAAKLLRRLRSTYPKAEILGHREAMARVGKPEHTTCPGGGGQWVKDLVGRLDVAPDELYQDGG